MDKKGKLEDYPYNLLIAARGNKMLELPPALTRDVQAGITYALFTLEESEQDVLDKKYRLGVPLSSAQQKTEKKAFKKMRYPNRWDYICYGIAGFAKKKVEEAKRKGFMQGYKAGYAAGVKEQNTNPKELVPISTLELPLEAMPLSSRVYNSLCRSGCKSIRDVATQDQWGIRAMRNLGEKGIQEVIRALHSFEIFYTEWELY